MVELTDEQEKYAVEKFAEGNTRSQVMTLLLDNDPDIQRQLEESGDVKAFRKALSDKLITTDPNSTRFAMTKHRDHYQMHREALTKALSNTYENQVRKSVTFLEDMIKELDEELEEIDHLLDTARETEPIGASEVISVRNYRMNVKKRKLELVDKYLERLERIHQKTIEF